MSGYTIDEARRIAINCASSYKSSLEDKQFIIIYRDKDTNMIKHIEVVFLARNYQHLTGLNMIDEAGKLLDHHSEFFYKKCVEKKLSCDEIVMRMDGTTQLKLEALPAITKFTSITKIVAIPNDATNEYRAFRILEQNGFIKLKEGVEDSLSASVDDIEEYVVPLEIVELDSAQIIPTKDDYDFFITNTNKALEAGIDSAKLFSEGADSPYANMIAVRSEDADNPAIKALVEALLDEDTQKFIEEKYDGAVIPVK
ncbi:MetQ/NlpA family ABC transporter substrate-binding protein [Butyrivibrio sp. WCD2001]|uniref:MetQ/NlpA family ABC transporter substrate-binding protein n=1 Tax=Butyrivibrio sp. WCD2001 TaxID=1280681 RepID=UPI000410FEA7|nr:MetQ/NlpA family ABC transporter substrate-binding protein [Butyrivibrio sp. WCD2001]